MRTAVLADTHGLLRASVLRRLVGFDAILHAGDVGKLEILDQLASIAPTYAVRGNVDHGLLAERLPASETVQCAGHLVHIVHDITMLDLDPRKAGLRLVVYGHSHQPHFEEKGGVAFLNPGSIGPRRFRLPIRFAALSWESTGFALEWIDLSD